MATVIFTLSKKKRKDTNECEVLARFSGGRSFVYRVKTEVFLNPENWDIEKGKVRIPRIHGKRSMELTKLQRSLDDLCTTILSAFSEADLSSVNKEWLEEIIYVHNHGKRILQTQQEDETGESSMIALLKYYLEHDKKSREKHGTSLILQLLRYEVYANFVWELDSVKERDLTDFEEFLRIESSFFDADHKCISHQDIYQKYPHPRACQKRCPNAIYTTMSLFRTFYNWAIKKGYTVNNPFKNHLVKEPPYGTPFYLTKEELDRLYEFDFTDKPSLALQRDVFVLQSLLACRVSDYYALTYDNIINGCIEYVADKKKEKTVATIRVPLTARAKEIIKRYEDHERKSIMPFISQQRYNDAIKVVLRTAGIDRIVTTINKTTREEEKHPIWEVATSHMARRNFIGIMYQKVQDPNIIGSMSGHAYGSRAFARYRTVNDDLKKDALSALE